MCRHGCSSRCGCAFRSPSSKDAHAAREFVVRCFRKKDGDKLVPIGQTSSPGKPTDNIMLTSRHDCSRCENRAPGPARCPGRAGAGAAMSMMAGRSSSGNGPIPPADKSGLGPLYNEASCASCHKDGGGARFVLSPGGDIAAAGGVLRLSSRDGQPDPHYGRQLHSKAIAGVTPEGRVYAQLERRSDGLEQLALRVALNGQPFAGDDPDEPEGRTVALAAAARHLASHRCGDPRQCRSSGSRRRRGLRPGAACPRRPRQRADRPLRLAGGAGAARGSDLLRPGRGYGIDGRGVPRCRCRQAEQLRHEPRHPPQALRQCSERRCSAPPAAPPATARALAPKAAARSHSIPISSCTRWGPGSATGRPTARPEPGEWRTAPLVGSSSGVGVAAALSA